MPLVLYIVYYDWHTIQTVSCRQFLLVFLITIFLHWLSIPVKCSLLTGPLNEMGAL